MPKPRKKRRTRISKRHVSVRPVYRDVTDTKALAKALVSATIREQ